MRNSDHELEQDLFPPNQRTEFIPPTAYGHDPAKGFVTERQLRVIRRYTRLRPRRRGTYPAPRPDQNGQKPNPRSVRIYRRVRFALPVNQTRRGRRPLRRHRCCHYAANHRVRRTRRQWHRHRLRHPANCQQLGDLGHQPARGRPLQGRKPRGVRRQGRHPHGYPRCTSTALVTTHSSTSGVKTRSYPTYKPGTQPPPSAPWNQMCNHLVTVGFGRDGDAHTDRPLPG